VRLADGRIDVDAWLDDLVDGNRSLDRARIAGACGWVAGVDPGAAGLLESGIEFAELAAAMELDTASVLAAIAYRACRSGLVDAADAHAVLGDEVMRLIEDVRRMGTASVLEMSNARLQTSERTDQVDNVRRMLVAMLNDARVAVLKIAERIVALRAAKQAPDERRMRIAREAHLVFAPLANRLGVWRLKWELEDLALRYLQPDIYISIARQLSGRREERERQVAEIAVGVQSLLLARGVSAHVSGRAKNIYSFWRKMQTKQVGIDQVYDVRAVRVQVDDIAQCYAALGVIHTAWRHVPSEFDDYIAAPKENGYRSIHTAVLGPDGRTLEVQIRTHDMHRESELGVCAHWTYKDRDGEAGGYAEKMNWLRQVVERRSDQDLRNPLAESTELGEELRQLFRDERIFVYTPKGHVVDLTADCTPIDFAYRVHTAIGHRCTGALVDGVSVALNTPLATGQRVEIVTGQREQPQRQWLDLHLGYVRTGRAREKLREWFRARPAALNALEGRERLETLLVRLALPAPAAPTLAAVAARLGFRDETGLFTQLGAGDCQLLDVVELIADVDASGADPVSETAADIAAPAVSSESARPFVVEI
ncbi:MAG: RelA/SpoT family protein, partial [Gammaproteobacteria bacterium]